MNLDVTAVGCAKIHCRRGFSFLCLDFLDVLLKKDNIEFQCVF